MGLRGIPDGLTATYLVKPTHCRTGTLFFQRVRNIKFMYPLIKIKDGQIVFNNGWAWIVVYQALNKRNFAIVKYCAGNYSVVEV